MGYDTNNVVDLPPITLRLFDGRILATCGWKVADITADVVSLLAMGLVFEDLPDGRVIVHDDPATT
jgi:hypothetical protein